MHIEHIQLVQLLMRLVVKQKVSYRNILVLKAQTNNSKDELKEGENGETSVEYDYAFTE